MQQTFDFTTGQIARDEGVNIASEHAEAMESGWNQKAYNMLVDFCSFRLGPFLMEDYRQWAEPSGLTPPPHPRAYGGIALRASKSGLIKKIGYAQVKNEKAHMANAAVWVANK